jgi:hypothetical protein
MSFFAGDIGPCAVVFDPVGTPVTLSIHAPDGANFESELFVAPVKTAQAGQVPVSEVTQGRSGKLTVQITESDLDELEAMIKGATLTGSKLTVANDVGNDLFALAKEVIVKPIKNGVISTAAAEWLHILKTYPKAKPGWKYNSDNQRVTEVVFDGYPSKDSGYLGIVWVVGKDVTP